MKEYDAVAFDLDFVSNKVHCEDYNAGGLVRLPRCVKIFLPLGSSVGRNYDHFSE